MKKNNYLSNNNDDRTTHWKYKNMTLPGDKDLFVAGYCCQFIFFAPHTSTNASGILCKNIFYSSER